MRDNRRWRESVVFERVEGARIEMSHNWSSGLAHSSTPVDFYKGIMVAFDIVDGSASEQVWMRRLATSGGGLEILPLKPDLNMKSSMRGAVIEGLTGRQHQREQRAAYRQANRKLGWRALLSVEK